METCYGEMNGFMPISGHELTNVDGGIIGQLVAAGVVLGIGALLSSCAQPTNPASLNQGATFGSQSESQCGNKSGSGGGGK
jgi:hypothetical protein